MAGFFDNSEQNGGLMGMYANPQMAGLLGFGQGLLQSSGASRLPVTMGQAFGNGLQGVGQGISNAMQMQQNMFRTRALQGLMGMGDAAGGQPAQSAPSYSSMFGPNSTAPASMPAYGGTADGSGASGAPSSAGTIYGKSPQQLFQQGMLMNMAGIQGGGDMMRIAVEHDPSLAAQMPTDITKMGTQAGWTPDQIQQANANAILKNNSLVTRPGGGIATFGPNGQAQFTMTPTSPAPGVNLIQDPTDPSGWRAVTVGGANAAIKNEAAAKAGGQAQYNLQQVWDPKANKGQGGFVYQSTANVADAANPSAPATQVPVGIRNNNFGNIKGANGQFATYDTPQAGIDAADKLLLNYGAKYGINTISGIANRWAPKGDGDNNPTAKAQAMAAASGVGVNEPINLSDPAVRSRILPALFDTETPGWRNAVGVNQAPQQQPQRGGPMAAQPPMGAQKSTETAQNAPSAQMAASYKALTDSDATYQQSRGALTDMLALAHQFGPYADAISKMPEGTHNMSNLVTQYDKAHATFVSNQYGALGAGTDASKGTVNDMVPSSDKPLDAQIHGLNTQLNNLDYRHLKTQLMAPLFQNGDQKGFTATSAQFDNVIKPDMMPLMNTLLGIQTKSQLAAAISRVNQQYPQYKKAIDFLGSHGMFDGVGQ
jgi:hypothetical protein